MKWQPRSATLRNARQRSRSPSPTPLLLPVLVIKRPISAPCPSAPTWKQGLEALATPQQKIKKGSSGAGRGWPGRKASRRLRWSTSARCMHTPAGARWRVPPFSSRRHDGSSNTGTSSTSTTRPAAAAAAAAASPKMSKMAFFLFRVRAALQQRQQSPTARSDKQLIRG